MSIDTGLIGRLAAELMECLPDETEGEIVAAGIAVVVDDGDGTWTRIKCFPSHPFAQKGLFMDALDVVRHGEDVEN